MGFAEFLARLLGKQASTLPLQREREARPSAQVATQLPVRSARATYEDTCLFLKREGWLEGDDLPPMPGRQPRFDDEEPMGVSFFRTSVSGAFENLTLPRTFFGRSEVSDASFVNTDLSESSMCWCDFVDTDFAVASLRSADLRASTFVRVRFAGCDLSDSDLRHASFEDCDFREGVLKGAKVTRRAARDMGLAPEQLASIDEQIDDGEEPGGG
jgi:BTB/POZ domain-containing protein KCTD9